MNFKQYLPDEIAGALMCCLGKHDNVSQDIFSPDFVIAIETALQDMKNKIDSGDLSNNYEQLYYLLNAITTFEKMY